MIDHIVGSEKYYLESIDAMLTQFVERMGEQQDKQNTAIDRVLDAFRALLNLENEAMVTLRELRSERNKEKINKARYEIAILFYDLIKLTSSPDFIKDYISCLEVTQLELLGNALHMLLGVVTDEAQKRIQAQEEIAKLKAEDAVKV